MIRDSRAPSECSHWATGIGRASEANVAVARVVHIVSRLVFLSKADR
jgi:hypothetical protein